MLLKASGEESGRVGKLRKESQISGTWVHIHEKERGRGGRRAQITRLGRVTNTLMDRTIFPLVIKARRARWPKMNTSRCARTSS